MASHGDRFRRRALSRGYKVDEVDAFLDRVEATLAGEPVGSPVSADEVDDVVFRVRFGGYDEWQVDVYLDRVARQLAELEERGVLGTAPAPDYGKPDATGPGAPMGGRNYDEPPAQAVGARRAPEAQATQVIPAATQAIPAHDLMAAREMAPPPPAPEPVGRGRAARAAAPPPPDNEGFGDLRGDDDEGFGFLAGPPGDDYDDPFAQRNGAGRSGGGQDYGRGGPGEFGPGQGDFGPPQNEFGSPRDEFGPGQGEFSAPRNPNGGGFGPRGGAPEPAVYGSEYGGPRAPENEYGNPRGPEPVRGEFAPPAQPGPRTGMPMHDGPQAGPTPHGATEQLPVQSDPRRPGFTPKEAPGGYGPNEGPGGYGPNDAPGVYGQSQGRRSAPDPAPGFGAAYDDEFSDTGSRRATPQPPPQGGHQGPPSGSVPQAGRYSQPEPEPMPPAAPTQAIPQNLVPGMGQGPMSRPEPPQPEPYGTQRGRDYGQGFGQQQEDTGYGRRAAAPSPPVPQQGFDRGQQHEPGGGFGGPPTPPPGPADNGFAPGPGPDPAFGQPAPRGAATPPDFGRRNPYEGRGAFEAPGRHGREEMTTEMRASDSPFTPEDVQRLEQMRRAFQPRRFGSGYDPSQVDQMFDAVSAAMTGRNPVPLSDRELDTSQFSLVQGGYFEAEVDSALREVREMFARRGMMR
ncbi:DivIVA domain-containing protein [Glycomyces sp. TRM65418]|uniref:DivIVA domain-containing protein n=1 Tax=Glycomyces sp. TRM65418 TaxID=2867006 RepID=UPI001CE66632|nr:DivIVA domain-containing protein [Glycomyces sp. TRM65418]MCC3762202.1 DivIVA domain-containing protein [Glycomyces sp. TRM65418]QZD56260.1 DivIVA domain-containing protein [Glycomyces sp. TRM65418]